MSGSSSLRSSPAGLSVALIVGSPGETGADTVHCGVRDYAFCLAQALRGAGVRAQVVAPASWHLRDVLPFLRHLRASRPDIVHLQYPSIGHRHSLLPHLIGLMGAGKGTAVTLHEHSALPREQRLANTLFRITTDRIVFTTEFEATAFGAPPSRQVIPIGSNIPVHEGVPDRGDEVLYFGQLRPGKGIEAFLALADLASAAGDPARFTVIGSAPPRWRDYARGLRAISGASVAWVEDAAPADVARAMAVALAAYLPFPDGAGLRRGSLIAALANGLPVIAPLGPSTTDALRTALLPAHSAEEALSQIRLVRASPENARECARLGRDLVQDCHWKAIAEKHLALYMRARGVRRGQGPLPLNWPLPGGVTLQVNDDVIERGSL